MAEDVTLTLVKWPVGSSVGAYPRLSEQQSDQMAPVVPVAQISTVAADNSLTYHALSDGEYWAAAPLGARWQYVAFSAETPEPTLDSLDERADVLEAGQIALEATDDSLDARLDALESAPPPDPGAQVVLSLVDSAQTFHGSTGFQFAGIEQIVIPDTGNYELAMTCRLALNNTINMAVGGIGINGVVDQMTELWHAAGLAFESETYSLAGYVRALNAGDVLRPMSRQTSASSVYIDHIAISARRVA